jgi:hypothetical protein
MTSRLLDAQTNGEASTTPKKASQADVQDDGYFATYNHYDIHKDMLQVR